MKSISFIILAATLSFASTPASADPKTDDKGKVHADRGQALYREGKYREARDEFSRGFDLSGRAAFVFNMAECSRLLGETAVARTQYDKYLALDPDGKLALTAKQRLASLPADPQVAAPGDAPDAKTPTVAPVVSTPAPSPVVRRADPLPTTSERERNRPPLVAMISGGAGIAALGLGSVLALRARGKWSDAEAHCVDNRCNATGFELGEDARGLANGATIMAIVGTVAIAGGGYLWWRDHQSKRAHAVTIVPAIAPSSIGVQIGGGF